MRPASSLRKRRQGGNLMVEVALTFTTFLLLTVGVIDLSYGVYGYNYCAYAAQEAARWASVHGTQSATNANCGENSGVSQGCPATRSDISSYAKSLGVGFNANSITVATNWIPSNAPGGEVDVTVSYSTSPLVGLVFSGNYTVSSTSRNYVVH